MTVAARMMAEGASAWEARRYPPRSREPTLCPPHSYTRRPENA